MANSWSTSWWRLMTWWFNHHPEKYSRKSMGIIPNIVKNRKYSQNEKNITSFIVRMNKHVEVWDSAPKKDCVLAKSIEGHYDIPNKKSGSWLVLRLSLVVEYFDGQASPNKMCKLIAEDNDKSRFYTAERWQSNLSHASPPSGPNPSNCNDS